MNRPYRDVAREPRVRINERVRAPEIRVIDENNEQLGLLSSRQAFMLARERGLDLVEVAPNARPPVCRIVDYGKYKYEQEKRERETKKKHHKMDVKGIQLRPGTDEHDIDVKIKNAIKFLNDGDKVKITLRFRSREITHPEIARRSMQRIMDATTEVAIVERPPTMEGRLMIMIIAPKAQPTPQGGQKDSAKAEDTQDRVEAVQDNG